MKGVFWIANDDFGTITAGIEKAGLKALFVTAENPSDLMVPEVGRPEKSVIFSGHGVPDQYIGKSLVSFGVMSFSDCKNTTQKTLAMEFAACEQMIESSAQAQVKYIVLFGHQIGLLASRKEELTRYLQTLRENGYYVNFGLHNLCNFSVPVDLSILVVIAKRAIGRQGPSEENWTEAPEMILKDLRKKTPSIAGILKSHTLPRPQDGINFVGLSDKFLPLAKKVPAGGDASLLSQEEQDQFTDCCKRLIKYRLRRSSPEKPLPIISPFATDALRMVLHYEEDRPYTIHELAAILGWTPGVVGGFDLRKEGLHLSQCIPVAVVEQTTRFLLELETEGKKEAPTKDMEKVFNLASWEYKNNRQEKHKAREKRKLESV